MDFKKLHETLPYVTGGKKHVLEYSPYNAVTLYFPGRHANDTDPVGGDFVVTVTDEELGWVAHQFTHGDIFQQVETYRLDSSTTGKEMMEAYFDIVHKGTDPSKYDLHRSIGGVLHPQTFLYAVQCLAVAEHRRYAKHEAKLGGRYLPYRFAVGIFNSQWNAADAVAMQRRGRPGVEILEKQAGIKFSVEAL